MVVEPKLEALEEEGQLLVAAQLLHLLLGLPVTLDHVDEGQRVQRKL